MLRRPIGKIKGFMCCPCRICQNNKEYSKRNTLHAHIYSEGFMYNYYLWTKHGEPVILTGPNEEEEDIPGSVHIHEVGHSAELELAP